MRTPLTLMTIHAAALVAAVTGCTLKPLPTISELQREALPHTAVPAAWKAAGGVAAPVSDRWLATFDEPELNALVEEALAYNADLQVAAARVEQAAGYVKAAGGSLYPAVNAAGRAAIKDAGGTQGGGLSVSWELDLWGRVRYGARAAESQYASAQADYAYARQSLGALVARGWFLATETALQRQLAQEIVGSSARLLQLAQERQRVGNGDALDVAAAEASLGGYRDALRQVELAQEQSLRALELLLGRYPAAALQAPMKLSTLPGPVPAGLPSELLERRPDVVAAERRVAAAFDRVEEARTAMLPTLSLTTGLGYVSSDIFLLKNINNPLWSFAAIFYAPLFRGGALEAQVEVRTAEQKQAIAEYARIGIRAFSDVENALSGELAFREREVILAKTVVDNQRALDLATIRYRVGTIDLRAVLQQQLALFAARSALLRVRSEQLVQRVNLHLALGGGWTNAADKPAPQPRAIGEPAAR